MKQIDLWPKEDQEDFMDWESWKDSGSSFEDHLYDWGYEEPTEEDDTLEYHDPEAGMGQYDDYEGFSNKERL